VGELTNMSTIFGMANWIKNGGGSKPLIGGLTGDTVIPKVAGVNSDWIFKTAQVLNEVELNKDNVFSFQRPVISPNGLHHRIDDENIVFYEGVKLEDSFPNDPLKESLGSNMCFDQPNGDGRGEYPPLSRLVEHMGFTPAGPYFDPRLPFVPVMCKIYNLPVSYYNKGIDKIQFTESKLVDLTDSESKRYYYGLLGRKRRQFVLFYGNTSKTDGELDPNYQVQFSKLKLVFLSLFMNISQKKDSFLYKYPIYSASEDFTGPKNKFLKTKWKGSGFDFYNLIDNRNEFLNGLIQKSQGNAYTRELYAIAYQLLVGQLESELGATPFLNPGVEKKHFHHTTFSSKIPLSLEVMPSLGYDDLDSQSELFADVKPVYNYTIPYFEKAMPMIPEIRLPNLYYMLAKDGPENFGASFLADPYEENKTDSTTQGSDFLSEYAYSQNNSLYENIANSFIICKETETSVYQNPKYTSLMNIILAPDFFDKEGFQTRAEDMKDLLPMYVEVSFDTEHKTIGNDATNIINLLADRAVIKHYIQSYIKFGGPKNNASSIVEEITGGGEEVGAEIVNIDDMAKMFTILDTAGLYAPLTHNIITMYKDPPEMNLYSPNSARTVDSDSLTTDFGKWFRYYYLAANNYDSPEMNFSIPKADNSGFHETVLFDALEGNVPSGDGLMFYMLPKKFSGPNLDISSVIRPKLAEIEGELAAFVEKHTQSYIGVNSSALSKSITLFYEIKKYDNDGKNIQNIFVQNNSPNQNKRKITYIDSQVKYGASYRYEIIAHKLVLGTDCKFRFENTPLTDTIAASVGYGKKMTLDIVYSAILNETGQKVGDYFNSPIVSGYSGPVLASLTTAPGTQLFNLFNPSGAPPEAVAGVAKGGFDVTGGDLTMDINIADLTPSSDASEGIYALPDALPPPTSGGFSNLSTFRAYTITQQVDDKEKEKPLLPIDLEDLISASQLPIFDADDETRPFGDDPFALGNREVDLTNGSKQNGETVGDATNFYDQVQLVISSGGVPIRTFGLGGSLINGLFGSSGDRDESVRGLGIDPTLIGLFVPANPANQSPACPDTAPYDPGPEDVGINAKLFVVGVDTYPKTIVSKVRYFTEANVAVLDDPPIQPIVNFYPQANDRRRLLITFENQAAGPIEEPPVELEPSDKAIFFAVRAAQKRMYQYQDGSYIFPNLRFKSDDFASEYQVFRITGKKPETYNDFYGSLYKTLDVTEETAYYESLQTNVKYYYVFRTKDQHGKLSNPSVVYQVEMVEDGGLVYPSINAIDLVPDEKQEKSKSFKRFLKIEAAYAQKVLNKQESNIADDGEFLKNFKPSLGILNRSIWNHKKFKFRIKAKNSCKAIDLNVNFVTKHTDTDEGPKSCN